MAYLAGYIDKNVFKNAVVTSVKIICLTKTNLDENKFKNKNSTSLGMVKL